MTHRARSVVLYGVVALWGVSVLGQMAGSAFGFEWVAPTGLNELGTAIVMWMLAANKKVLGALGDSPEERAQQPPPSPPPSPRRGAAEEVSSDD